MEGGRTITLMSVAQEAPIQSVKSPSVPPPHNGRWAGYRHLLAARLLELKREPEVVFWVFVFPLLLALGLGIAFRNKPADVPSLAIVAGPSAQHTLEALRGGSWKFRVDILESDDALNRFRLGKYDLVIVADKQGFTYRYDPARPEIDLARSKLNE